MDLITLTTVITGIGFGVYLGKLLASYFGPIGGIGGFLAGVSFAVLLRYLTVLFLCRLFPARPPCKNCNCREDDYEFVENDRNDGAVIWRCKCGTKYVMNLPYFKEVLTDGSTKPYMKKNRFGHWIPYKQSENRTSSEDKKTAT